MNAMPKIQPHPAGPLSPDLLAKMQAYWRAANYLSVGQIYLKDNALLEEPLTLEHIKPRLLGHWGTTPGLNFLYVHLNRLIKENDLNMMYVIGPGHGGPGIVANTYLEGSYTERYPAVERSRNGLHPQPCLTEDAGLHSRGRRTWLFAAPCLWRRV